MFADSLLEQHFTRSHRGWTTLTSFALQAVAVGAALIVPLFYTEAIPKIHLVWSAPIGPPPGPPPAMPHAGTSNLSRHNLLRNLLLQPHVVPIGIAPAGEGAATEPAPCAFCVTGGTGPIASTNPVFNSIGTSAAAVPPPPPPPSARPPRVSHMMEGNLIYRVQPIYPSLARAARIQGSVVLRAIISRTGTIENLQTISGHPMLVGAALDAVRKWRYRPYILNGDPVEVETQVTVNFSLTGG